MLRSAGNQNLGPACIYVCFEVTHDMSSHYMLRADLGDPFAQDKKNDAIRRALTDPLNVFLPAPEEDKSEKESSWERKETKDIMRRETKLQQNNEREKAETSKPSKFPVVRYTSLG